MVSPRGSTPTKGTADFKAVTVGDPMVALRGFELNLEQVERSTGVDATRSGVSSAVEQTAFEVSKKDQRSEVRLVDFVSTFERQALKAFLYMQHDLNKKKLENYPFYNSEIHTADFIRATKKDLNEHAKSVHFEITGSKGTLGEERRREGSLAVTERLMQTEMGQQLVNLPEIAKDAYSDYGVKDPERYLNIQDEGNPQLQAMQQQFQQVIEQLQAQIGELNQELQKDSLLKETHKAEKAALQAKVDSLSNQVDLIEEQKQLSESQRQAYQKIDAQSDRLEKDKMKFELDKLQSANDSKQQSLQAKEEVKAVQSQVSEVVKTISESEAKRTQMQEKIFKFIESQGGKAAEFVRGIDAGQD